jgi:two-component system phosphate regulon sensor histidine kinase PhoR
MGLVLLGLAFGIVLAVLALRFYRRWVEPWEELEELVHSITHGETPRKFLTTANKRANAVGLGLELFASKQRQLERTANDAEISLHNILSALPDGVAVVDEERHLQLINPRLHQLFASAKPGMTVLEVVRDPAVDRAVAVALENKDSRGEKVTISHGTSARHEFEVTAIPFLGQKTRAHGAVVLFRDVTEMRQVEELRKDFVANVSHELRTPLSIFRGYLETLLDDPEQSPEEMARILEVMDRHADRLTLLVEDILSLAQLESAGARLDFDEIELPEFLSEILRDWEKRFTEKNLRGSLAVADELPLISADERRLQEIVYNLLDNAVKYSHPNGAVVLGAETNGDSVCIFVTDQGMGIPTRDLPRVFERFYRVDKARSRELGGTGLGLSIVKHIAQMHGGHVQAESALGRGTTIRVFLPLAAPRPEDVPAQLEEAVARE